MIFEALSESAERGELILIDGGLLNYHVRKDGQVTIREIIVLPERRRQRIGSQMLFLLRVKCFLRADSIFAKCPTNLEAGNKWFKAMGFSLEARSITRRGRTLNHWRLMI